MKKKKVFYRDENKPDKRGEELSKESMKLFGWVFKYLNKKPETDLEKDVQKIYTNMFIF